jgi:hypothetical protein
MLVVQVVEILWTKATRGAPRSNERVMLPRVFPIASGRGECMVQRHRIAEWEEFSPKLVKAGESLPLPGGVDVLRISRHSNGSFTLGVLGTPNAGQPKRRPIQRAVDVASGQYVRITINARHTTYSGQYYSETVYNVACGEEVEGNRFLLGPPDHDVDLKENLF